MTLWDFSTGILSVSQGSLQPWEGHMGSIPSRLSFVQSVGFFPDQHILIFSQSLQSECSSLMAFTSQSCSVPCSESLVSLASTASSLE